MFGVDRSGKDTLSPQFKKGKAYPGRVEANPLQQDPEKMMAVQSNLDSLRRNKDFLARMRQEAADELGPNATEGDIQALVENKAVKRAEQLYEMGRADQAEASSRSGIIRM